VTPDRARVETWTRENRYLCGVQSSPPNKREPAKPKKAEQAATRIRGASVEVDEIAVKPDEVPADDSTPVVRFG